MVRLKRAGISTTGHALQHRRFDLQKVALIEPATHGAHRHGPAPEGFAGVGRHDQIEIALAVALLHIRQAMPLVGQGLEALAEHGPALHLHRKLTAIGAAQAALHADQVAGIHQGGEVGESLGVLRHGRLEGGLLNKQLNRTGFISQGEEGELAHHAASHHPARHGHFQFPLITVGQVGMVLLQSRRAVAGLKAQGVRTLAEGG